MIIYSLRDMKTDDISEVEEEEDDDDDDTVNDEMIGNNNNTHVVQNTIHFV